MKPKIGVVFPKITDKDIADLEIEKIRVSKNRRKIGILLGSDTSAYQQAKVESEVKKACNLTEVIVRVDNRIKQQDKNVMIYEVEPGHEGTMQSASSGPKSKVKPMFRICFTADQLMTILYQFIRLTIIRAELYFRVRYFLLRTEILNLKKLARNFTL